MVNYDMLKRVIQTQKANNTLDKEDMFAKLDVFLEANRITSEQYQELVIMLDR